MTEPDNLLIAPLNPSHDRRGFQCGVTALDDYIQKQANQDVKRRISRVFVATPAGRTDLIAGYYTLSSLSIEYTGLPEALARKLPRHPIPAALLGRLAVANTAQGRGVGRMLLIDAIKRTLAVSGHIGIHAMIVDAIDERAQRFYQQFGFSPLDWLPPGSQQRRLFLPLKPI